MERKEAGIEAFGYPPATTANDGAFNDGTDRAVLAHGRNFMRQIGRHTALGLMALTAGFAVMEGEAGQRAAQAQGITSVDARIVALNIPGASAIAEVGTFLNVPPPGACANPIPSKFPSYIQPGAILDPKRILVGSRSNFGAPLASGGGEEGSLLSIDPSGASILRVPANFAQSGGQASILAGAVQMFSANSPHWLNGANNPGANTASYAGVSNPLGLSNNNAFGRIWPANAPFGDAGIGSSSIDDPTGLPLAAPPNNLIGGVYAGSLTDRDVVAAPPQSQVISGSLSTGAVGTALLGPSPDGTCKAVFAVVTADGAVVQEHTLKGLDGLAGASTVWPLLGHSWGDARNEGDFHKADYFSNEEIEPRLGVIMNPYTQAPIVRQLFVSEPFQNTIAVLSLVNFGVAPNQVFGLSTISRIGSPWLNLPVDLAPVHRDKDNVNWASNTTLDQGSDFYVANRGNNTIVRMRQDGDVVAARRIRGSGDWRLDDDGGSLNGIATSSDGATIYVTFTDTQSQRRGGVLALPAF